MTIRLDNRLSPTLADWIAEEFGEPCLQIRDLGLERAPDVEIFDAAGKAARIFITKDRDFAELVARRGPPPHIILVSVGHTGAGYLKHRLRDVFASALALTAAGEPIVEIGGRS